MARRYDILVGAINGSNRTFTFPNSQSYVSGTVTLIWNGLAIPQSDTNGFSEVNTNTILLNFAPISGDTIVAFYDDGIPESVAFDIRINGIATRNQLDWNVGSYNITYSVSNVRLDYNTTSFSLTYNTNQFTVGN